MTLTIGTFDGVHVGHKHLFAQATEPLTAVTFYPHPAHLFSKTPPPLLITLEHRLKLLKEAGVTPHLLHFTQTVASTPFDLFLLQLRKEIPFTTLLLGEGAVFGKGRGGTQTTVELFAKQQGFHVQYVPKTLFEGLPVSSGRIRDSIRSGDFIKASTLLGRPYSILAPMKEHQLLLPKEPFCLPPPGKYPVTCKGQNRTATISETAVYLDDAPPSQKLVEIVFK